MKKEKLRIGLLIDDYSIPLWAYKMLQSIQCSHHSEITLIVKREGSTRDKTPLLKRVWQRRDLILFQLYARLENKLFRAPHDAFEPKDLKELIHCAEIVVKPKETKHNDFILQEDIDQIKHHHIDVFIRLGFRILKGAILNSSKYGIWSYHHGDNKVNRGGPAGVWEVLEQWEETGAILQILTEDLDKGVVLQESFSSTDNLSINRNRNNYYWKVKSFIPRKLEELHRLGEELFFDKVKQSNSKPYFYYNRLYTSPKNKEILRAALKNYGDYARRRIRRFFYFNQWIPLFRIEKTNAISQTFFRFTRILPPKDRFWADPFVIQKDDTYYVFMEEYVYAEGKGKITVMTVDENGKHSQPKVVLVRDYHLSYPFLLEEKGVLYMIPETSENKTIELYSCTNFPMEWKLEKVLIPNVHAVDSTIFKKDGKYWLFTNIRENEGASSWDELFLFYSDDLLNGEWKPHPKNPIVSDVKCARPAGNIFVYEGHIFRPAQNCSKHYGYGMQIMEIITLNENEYAEENVQSIHPNWEKDLISTHTLNAAGKLTVIDALIKRKK